MEQYVLKLYKVYINDDPELTLTHFKTMSKLAKLVFVPTVGPGIRRAFTGPLVLWFINVIFVTNTGDISLESCMRIRLFT